MCPQLLIALKSVMGLFSPLGCRFGTSINTYRRDCFTLFGNVAAPYPFDNKVQFTSIHYHVSSFLAIAIYYKYFSHIYTISLNIVKSGILGIPLFLLNAIPNSNRRCRRRLRRQREPALGRR